MPFLNEGWVQFCEMVEGKRRKHYLSAFYTTSVIHTVTQPYKLRTVEEQFPTRAEKEELEFLISVLELLKGISVQSTTRVNRVIPWGPARPIHQIPEPPFHVTPLSPGK